MPTPFAVVVLALGAVAAVVGVVLWVRQRSSRDATRASSRGTGPDAPWDEDTAAAQQMRQGDRGGAGLGL